MSYPPGILVGMKTKKNRMGGSEKFGLNPQPAVKVNSDIRLKTAVLPATRSGPPLFYGPHPAQKRDLTGSYGILRHLPHDFFSQPKWSGPMGPKMETAQRDDSPPGALARQEAKAKRVFFKKQAG